MINFEIFDEYGIFNPELAAKFFGIFVRFKGGSKPKPPSSLSPSSFLNDTEIKKYARTELYPIVTNALDGKGYGTGQWLEQKKNSLYNGLDDSYNTANDDFKSQINRIAKPEDDRLKEYLSDTMNREYITKKDDISRYLRSEKASDKDMAMGLSADYLANEKRMSIQGGQMYNNAIQANMDMQSRMGTFGSNISSGIGSALGSLYGSYMIDQKYANKIG